MAWLVCSMRVIAVRFHARHCHTVLVASLHAASLFREKDGLACRVDSRQCGSV